MSSTTDNKFLNNLIIRDLYILILFYKFHWILTLLNK